MLIARASGSVAGCDRGGRGLSGSWSLLVARVGCGAEDCRRDLGSVEALRRRWRVTAVEAGRLAGEPRGVSVSGPRVARAAPLVVGVSAARAGGTGRAGEGRRAGSRSAGLCSAGV